MKKMLKKMSAFSIGPLVAALIGFITVPIITHIISRDEYGRSSMFTVAQSVISMVIYLGLDQAFVREFNAFRGERKKLLWNALVLPAALSILISFVILALSPWISQLLFDSREEILPVFALAAMLPFMVVYNFALLSIRMQERGLLYSFFTIALKAVTLAATLLLLLLAEKSFRSIVYAVAAAEILNGIGAGIFLAVSAHRDRTPAPLDKALLGRMLRYGLPLIPASLLVWILGSMDKVMLRSLMDFDELGLYEAAFKIANVLGIVQAWFVLFWVPVAYRWHEEKRPEAKFTAVMKMVSVLMTVLCLCVLLAKELVGLILGRTFRDAVFIFPFLLLHPIMYVMSETTALGINFSRRTSFSILVSAVSGAVNILLNALFIPLWGGRGAAFATGLSFLVFFWMRTLISRKLWYRFPLAEQILFSALILANCAAHTFVTEGPWAYLVSAVSLILVVVLSVPGIRKTREILTMDDGVQKEETP
ncbi:MAG: polysaccharide biosynthesis protein [Lachnospiraceae bacterium]|nr:polysaccharide biosynthesis protein [Lachnospiraceae bacterium]